MGRKSTKAREKKLQLKEEQNRIAAAQELVNAANKRLDLMDDLPVFQKYNRNGLTVTFSVEKAPDMSEDVLMWAFNLTKKNMKNLYEEAWGWDEKIKQAEMKEDLAQYLIARDSDGKPVALSHFRFDLEDDEEVLYCYEIQLEEHVRRKGLGKFMMQILELLAYKNKMGKVMLTVLKNNKDADGFYKSLKYTQDEISPELSVEEGLYGDEIHYQILSKPICAKLKAA